MFLYIYHCIEVQQNVRQLKQPNAQRHQIDFSHLFLRWKLIDFFFVICLSVKKACTQRL